MPASWRELVVASYIDDTRLRCMSPSGSAAGSSGSMHFDFSSQPLGLRTYGHPAGCSRVVDGVLQLTAPDFDQIGSAVIDLASPGTLSEFMIEFDMYVGEGSVGEGLSFNVGALPPAPFGEQGVRSGLTVQLLMPSHRVEVWHNNAMLTQSTSEFELVAGAFTHVAVELSDGRLSVLVAGAVRSDRQYLHRWVGARAGSRSVGFGARTGKTRHGVALG